MNFLLELGKSDYSDVIINSKGPVETFLFGAKILLIGMATVFAVLCLIWLCLALFRLIFQDLASGKRQSTVKVAEVSESVEAVQDTTSEEEIIAVLAAAIAMAESENSGVKFKVVSFKRK